MNIVTAYIAMMRDHGMTRADALRDLNEATGLNIRSNRLYEIEHGKRPLPADAHRYMAECVAERVLRQVTGEVLDLTDDQAAELAAAFSPPARAE
ncbi:MAG TPA: hypothetical protein VK973_02090 [Arenicellales bacterium]|nr:hypothetical protein [Arenicellales bacterium]